MNKCPERWLLWFTISFLGSVGVFLLTHNPTWSPGMGGWMYLLLWLTIFAGYPGFLWTWDIADAAKITRSFLIAMVISAIVSGLALGMLGKFFWNHTPPFAPWLSLVEWKFWLLDLTLFIPLFTLGYWLWVGARNFAHPWGQENKSA